MIGVYIKGMKTPQSCYMCDMLELSGVVGCKHAYDTKNIDWGRALNCPLIEVPDNNAKEDVLLQLMDDLNIAEECEKCPRWDGRCKGHLQWLCRKIREAMDDE